MRPVGHPGEGERHEAGKHRLQREGPERRRVDVAGEGVR
jgi:hypothetical protein